MNSKCYLVVDLNLNNLCNLDLVISKAMFTQNIKNEGPVRLKNDSRQHVNWKIRIRLEIHFISKERDGLCRSLFRMPSVYIIILSWIISSAHVCYICATCFRLCSSRLFSANKKHGRRKAKQSVYAHNECQY